MIGALFVDNDYMTESEASLVPRTARDIAHAEMQRRILAAARAQLTTVGPAQLSLRAIARELGIVSSAIYRYVASRDELITRLILQSFTELADEVEKACRQVGPQPWVQWHTWAHALHDWALEHPYDWALIYGIPVPGYAAPTETIEPARRVNQPVLELYPQLAPTSKSSAVLDASERALAPLHALLSDSDSEVQGSYGVTTGMMLAWSGVHGFITLELGGHFQGSVHETPPVFTALVEHLGQQLEMGTA